MYRVSTLLATSLLALCVYGLGVSTQGVSALSGTITSTSGEKMEGVTVSARPAGRNVTTSVFTDQQGEYYFPPMESGKYKVWAQAQGFDAGRADVTAGATRANQNFRLKPLQEFEAQLSGDVWFAALPETTREDRRMKEVFRMACMGCHSTNYTLITKYDEKGWKNIINVMSRIGSYAYGDPVEAAKRAPNPIMTRFGDSLAAYLAKVRGPGPSPMKFTPRRPKADSTLAIVREYDGPEPGFGLPLYNDGSDWSLGAPEFMDEAHHHSMNATVDHDGNIWMADIFNLSFTVAKFDGNTGQVTKFAIAAPAAPRPAANTQPAQTDPGEGGRAAVAGVPANSHDIFTADDGTVWFDMSSIGALGRVDPRVGRIEVLRPPMGDRVGAFIGQDGKGGIWASTNGGAVRYDTQTKEWTRASNPMPNMSTYGMTGDRDGNGWWSVSNPSDGLVKADVKTGKTSFIAVPRPTNNRSDLFTPEELSLFETVRLSFTGGGRPGTQAIRKPGGDPKRDVVWGPGWFGGLVKVDTRTNKATSYAYPQGESNTNAYEASVDADGNVWVAFTHDDMIGKFDPTTEKWTSYYLPSIGVKTHGLVTASVNGKTYVGMGYLGLGKVAKLEFRTREKLQALKAQGRAPR